MDTKQQTIALAGTGILESVVSAFTYSSHTWSHVSSRGTGKETIWETPT